MLRRLKFLYEFGYLFIYLFALTHHALSFIYSMNHSGVIATPKQPGNCRVTQVGKFTKHIHGCLACLHKGALAAFAAKGIDLKTQMLGNLDKQLFVSARFDCCTREQIGE